MGRSRFLSGNSRAPSIPRTRSKTSWLNQCESQEFTFTKSYLLIETRTIRVSRTSWTLIPRYLLLTNLDILLYLDSVTLISFQEKLLFCNTEQTLFQSLPSNSSKLSLKVTLKTATWTNWILSWTRDLPGKLEDESILISYRKIGMGELQVISSCPIRNVFHKRDTLLTSRNPPTLFFMLGLMATYMLHL